MFVIKIAIVLAIAFTAAASAVFAERKVAAYIQCRIGPNRVGPKGLLQPFADVLKLIMKEDIVPYEANKVFHKIGPMITLTVAFAIYAVIPFGDFFYLNGEKVYLGIATSPNINIGVLFILAMTGLNIYGVTLSGWSSNNKYSLLGGVRSSAQMVSYEIVMGLALVGVILITGSFGLTDIVNHQDNWKWNLFLNPIGFLLYLTASFAETNRTPFDFPECEQELVNGFNTEYSGMKFGIFYLAEYINVFTVSLIMSLLYLGGWTLPFPSEWIGLEAGSFWLSLIQLVVLLVKTSLLVFFFFWVRWTIPRFKYNQLMDLGWKVFLPLGLLNIILTAIGVYCFK